MTTPSLKPYSATAAKLLIAASLLLGGLSAYGLLGPEEPQRGWTVPTAPQEKAAYDYAHNLKLPDSVPKPAPFNFTLAGIKALWPTSPSVSKQYFEHLCATEAGEYIFKTVEDVEGVFQMRPRPQWYQPASKYGPEDPTGLGGSGDRDLDAYGVSGYYVQPMLGQYLFLERPAAGKAGAVLRYTRGTPAVPPGRAEHSTGALIDGKWVRFNVPFVIVQEEASQRKARYGYTWRGITREQDRELGIGGGEYLIVDLDTKEVLAVKRGFRAQRPPYRVDNDDKWDMAQSCKSERTYHQAGIPVPLTPPVHLFVKKVLRPFKGANDSYVPPNHQPNKD